MYTFDDVAQALQNALENVQDESLAMYVLQVMDEWGSSHPRSRDDLLRIPGFAKLWAAMERGAASCVDEANSPEACPGCGWVPGDGINPDCNHPEGCGFWRAEHALDGEAKAEEPAPVQGCMTEAEAIVQGFYEEPRSEVATGRGMTVKQLVSEVGHMEDAVVLVHIPTHDGLVLARVYSVTTSADEIEAEEEYEDALREAGVEPGDDPNTDAAVVLWPVDPT